MRKYHLLLPIFCATFSLFFMTGCLQDTYLNHFSGTLIPYQGRIHIESGGKNAYTELGVTANSSFTNQEAQFTKYTHNSTPPGNCRLYFPSENLSIYASMITKELMCYQFQTQLSRYNDITLYNISCGIGVRLYKGPVAGRAILSTGIAKLYADASVLSGSKDLLDTYNESKFYIAATFAFNTTIPSLPINFFQNINVRYSNIFKYDEIKVNLLSLSTTLGIYKQLGNVQPSIGLQLNAYGDETQLIYPELITQITFSFPLKSYQAVNPDQQTERYNSD